MKEKRKLPIVEIALVIVLIISTAAFFMLQDRMKNGGNGQNASGMFGNGGNYDKYNDLVQADAEDEETYKKLYLFSRNINKETYFKYQIKHIGEEVAYYSSEEKLDELSKNRIKGIQKLTVTGVEVLDSYKEGDSEDCYVSFNYGRKYEELMNREEGTEGYKFIRVTVSVHNTLDEAYVWKIYNDCALMGEDGRFITGYERIAEEFPKDEEIQFYEMLHLKNENSSSMIPCDSVTGSGLFLMEAGATHTFSQVFLVPEEVVTAENLVYGDWESVKGRESAAYKNGGFRVYLNQ